MRKPVSTWLNDILLASLFAAPREPGLTANEIHELGRKSNYGKGEIDDALRLRRRQHVAGRYQPDSASALIWLVAFHEHWEDDPRDQSAFGFVFDEFIQLKRDEGETNARIGRDILVARAEAKGIDRDQVEIAVAALLASGHMQLDGDLLVFLSNYAHPNSGARYRKPGSHPIKYVLEDVRDQNCAVARIAVRPRAIRSRHSQIPHSSNSATWSGGSGGTAFSVRSGRRILSSNPRA
jgi:hypothetical protein